MYTEKKEGGGHRMDLVEKQNTDYIPRKRVRLTSYDYAACGAYFITFCTKSKAPLLWDAPLLLSKLGQFAEGSITEIEQVYPRFVVDKYCIMADHIHMIVFITPDEDGKAPRTPTVSHMIQQLKGVVSKQAGGGIWQKSYNDRIIRNESEYLRIWQYIDNNPAQWELDRCDAEEMRLCMDPPETPQNSVKK